MVTVAETGESREPSVTFWIKVATSRVLRLQGGEAKLRRQLRFLVASFWRLASQVGGLVSKLPSASVKYLSIIGRNGGEGGPPYFNGKGESPFHSRSSTTTFRPTWSRTKTENCVDRRRKRTMSWSERLKKEREWWPLSPRGHRRRTMAGTGWEPSVGYAL